MKTIRRNHNFENVLNFVKMGKKYFYLYHEKTTNPIKITITEKGKIAFNNEDWRFFEKKEAAYFGGESC